MPHTPNRRRLLGLLLGLASLVACAQNTPAPSQLPALRVIVQFQRGADFDATTFLRAVRTKTKATADYIDAVSADTHVFAFAPPLGSTYGQLLLQIGEIPNVLRVEADQKAKSSN
ncbi:hypothetical protein [Rhodoferax aquaticus]|uniref:Inhibitor I9 domain-containing protein n=1 Tax=Rhodoferax aquaticus TaxID=2527691 RepID=A0A515ELF3_9BURK|nr:hypothetical protein [Rhodoferax aquaticus]QDL53500.1 hypothetical protein EXZ61_04530 [Rhodoferax aquaticus]